MTSWWIAYAGLLINAYRLYVKWYPEDQTPNQVCLEWAPGADGDLCTKWMDYYTWNLPNGANADLYRYAQKCGNAGKALALSDSTEDTFTMECIDACPDGSHYCVVGKMAEQNRARGVKKQIFFRGGDASKGF